MPDGAYARSVKKFTTHRTAEKQKWVGEDAHFYKQATPSGVKGTGNVMQ